MNDSCKTSGLSAPELRGEYSVTLFQGERGRGSEISFPLMVEASGAELRMVALTPFGNRGMFLRSSGGEVEGEVHPAFRLPLSPESFLQLFLLAWAPEPRLRERCGESFRVTSKPIPVRRIIDDGKLRFHSILLRDPLNREVTVVSEPFSALFVRAKQP